MEKSLSMSASGTLNMSASMSPTGAGIWFPRGTGTHEHRTRSEWLTGDRRKIKGEVRNIHALGNIGGHMDNGQWVGHLVIAYQGQGTVRVWVGDQHTLELPLMIDLETEFSKREEKYRKRVHDIKLKDGSSDMRFAEFEIRKLPANLVIVGATEPAAASGVDLHAPAAKPVQETHIKAKLSCCGQVTDVHRFLAQRGAPTRPSHTGAYKEKTLSASQKLFQSGV